MIHKVSRLNGATSKILRDAQTQCMLTRVPIHRIMIVILLFLSLRVNKQNSWWLTQLFVYDTAVLTKPTPPPIKYNGHTTEPLFYITQEICTLKKYV